MGYDLHITRADAWLESESAPITRQEWQDFARSHPTLVEAGSAEIGAEPVYDCVDASGLVAALSWQEDHIYVYGFNGDQPAALLDIASKLDAELFGDDDERYTIDGVVQ